MFHYPNIQSKPNPTTENGISLYQYDDRYLAPYSVDLRPIADDRRIVRNPHKGWYWHYIDNGYLRDNYRVHHDPADHLEDFPMLNHLYLRFDWGDIEKEEGVYDWSYIDSIMEEWSKFDYRFGIRLVTYEAEGSIPFATPEYVYKAGAHGYALDGNRLEPDYSDPIFLEKLSRFLEEAGRKFDHDPRVELVDVGTFGTWGEGHTFCGTDIVYPAEVIKTHIDLHLRNFPHKFVILNDDHINHRWSRGREENLDLIRYAADRGLGLDDDSVCVRYYAENCGYNTLRTPWLFDYFWENAPIVLEFEHYQNVAPEVFKGGYPFLDAMQRTHATFAGFHGYPRPWLARDPYLTEYAANRLGYWFFMDAVELPPLVTDAQNRIVFHVANRGFGPCYRKYTMRVRLTGDGGRWEGEIEADTRTWRPGAETVFSAMVRPSGIPAGKYALEIGLFEGERPIEWAITEKNRTPDGYYRLCEAEVATLR